MGEKLSAAERERTVFDVLWPLQSWEMEERLCLAASAAVVQALDRTTRGEDARLREALADPVAVHLNMLRGEIAKPSIANIVHLYGADALRAALQGDAAHTSQEKGE